MVNAFELFNVLVFLATLIFARAAHMAWPLLDLARARGEARPPGAPGEPGGPGAPGQPGRPGAPREPGQPEAPGRR
ncbi:unnamed protein product [Orchesella dallaii]|uniref:Uncharacterized protein n=1 Tax=Orchesella dallaii TaxID=48710 RepID=A0ABP1RFV4_9HEXA